MSIWVHLGFLCEICVAKLDSFLCCVFLFVFVQRLVCPMLLYLWIVHSWLPLRFFLMLIHWCMFVCVFLNTQVWCTYFPFRIFRCWVFVFGSFKSPSHGLGFLKEKKNIYQEQNTNLIHFNKRNINTICINCKCICGVMVNTLCSSVVDH